LIAGPIGPSLDGSLLWQATQFATYTALPLCQSAPFDESSDSLEHAATVKPARIASQVRSFIGQVAATAILLYQPNGMLCGGSQMSGLSRFTAIPKSSLVTRPEDCVQNLS